MSSIYRDSHSQAFLKSLQIPSFPCGPSPIYPAFDLFIKLFILSFDLQRVPDTSKPCKARFVSTLIREVVAVPIAKVVRTGCKVKLSDSPATTNTVPAQRADKPVSNSTEITGRSGQLNLIVIIGFFSPGLRSVTV